MDKLDKTIFVKQSHKEANDNKKFWLAKSVNERLVAAYRLSLRAYNLDPDIEHKMDKTFFTIKKRT